jgi:two-component system, cell cycle sensor histidine kinase and response regulator CckA
MSDTTPNRGPADAAPSQGWLHDHGQEQQAVVVALVDGRGIVRSVSGSITAVAGYAVTEMVGHSAVEFIHPEDVGGWNALLAPGKADQPEAAPARCRFRHRDGAWIPVTIEGMSRLEDPPATAHVLTIRDETARQLAAERSRRFALAIEQGPAAVVMTDVAGRIEYVNRRFTEMTGYLPAEALGKTPRILKSGLTPKETYQRLWATILAGEVWRGELCNRRKDGALYWHSASISPVRDASGRISGFVAVQEDATERRRFLEALAAKEAEYRRIVDTAAEGIWGVDADHRTTFVNERLASMLGYEAGEMIGRPVFDFTDEEGRAIAEASRRRRRELIREQLDFKLQRRDGSTLWVLMSTGPVVDDQGRYAGALAMVTDMTARREAEQALRRSEAWFRTLIEEVQSLIAVVAADGTIRFVSPSYERILGYPSSELVGHPAFDFIHPEDLARVTDVFEEGALQPGAARAIRFRHRHKDGSWRVIDGVGRNLLDDPIVAGAIFNGRDVTAQLALEAQFRQAQKMEAVGRLVGGVAHDFNNILGVILGSSALLLEDLPPEHPSQVDVELIRSAGERAAGLTRQLLAFSRQQVLVPRVFDLNELIRNMLSMLSRVLRDDITLGSRLAPGPAMVRADPTQLEQVLLNLAVNSRDAMPHGGDLVLETALVDLGDAYLERHAQMRPGPHVQLTVSDTGIGMAEETQARAFEPFFTTKESGKGTGLGLSTVYGIVKQSDGFIWLYSELGRGTTFKIYLPQVDPMVGTAVRAEADSHTFRGDEVVLLAEDDAGMRSITRRALERHGYTVLDGAGAAALDLARRWEGTIHLLLTDVVMPGMGGPELTEALRRLRPGLRIVYMSGYADAMRRAKVAEGGEPFLQKPFSVFDLVRTVREALDRPGPPAPPDRGSG